jgi:hypothetical protein
VSLSGPGATGAVKQLGALAKQKGADIKVRKIPFSSRHMVILQGEVEAHPTSAEIHDAIRK